MSHFYLCVIQVGLSLDDSFLGGLLLDNIHGGLRADHLNRSLLTSNLAEHLRNDRSGGSVKEGLESMIKQRLILLGFTLFKLSFRATIRKK